MFINSVQDMIGLTVYIKTTGRSYHQDILFARETPTEVLFLSLSHIQYRLSAHIRNLSFIIDIFVMLATGFFLSKTL